MEVKDQQVREPTRQYIKENKINIQGIRLNKQFLQFIQDDQYKCLVEYHPLTSTKTDKWQQQVIVFYDMLIDYFLKNNPQFILLQDSELKLEIKQYFISNPMEVQVINIVDNRIQDFKIGLYYNRQLNVYGFIVPTPNGCILRGKHQQMRNTQLNLFKYQDDILQKYKDNRVNMIEFLNNLNINKVGSYQAQFALLYKSQLALNNQQLYRLKQSNKKQLIYKLINDIPLDDALKQFVQILTITNPDLLHIIEIQGSIVYGNTQQIMQYLNRLGIFHLFLSFIYKLGSQQVINGKSLVIQSNMNKSVDRNIGLSQNYDLNFDLRVLQYLYKQSFGFNDQVRNAKTPDDFYATIPANLIVIMQDKLKVYKQQKTSKCSHIKIVQDLHIAVSQNEYEYAYNIILQILETYAVEIPIDQQVKVFIGEPDTSVSSINQNLNGQQSDYQHQSEESKDIQNINKKQKSKTTIIDKTAINGDINEQKYIYINYDTMYCRQCSQQILCYHELLNILKYIEKLPLEYYDKIVQQFLVRDLNIFAFSSFCSVCGGAFPIKLELQQIYENIDPLKKYTVLKKTFKILFVTIITSFQFPQSIFVQDFIQHYYHSMKQELQQFKHQSNYAQRKQKLVALFVSSYIYSLKGDNVTIDLKQLYKYAQQSDLAYDQFINTLTQLQDKFDLKSSIVIPSLGTVKQLYNTLRIKPIIGQIIQNDPIKLTKLLEQQLPIYPNLYEMDKYLPYFNVDIQTLSPQVISKVLDTAAVDIENRKSSVVDIYVQVKRNAGRHMERNSTSYSNRLVYIDHYRYKDIPKPFIIENYKSEFYEIICPVTKLAHTDRGNCDKCKSIDINKVSNQAFHSLFFKTNNLPQIPRHRYPDIQPIAFPSTYSTNTLYTLSKEFVVHPLQVQNFGGFSFIEARSIQQYNTLESLVVHQMSVYQTIYKTFTYSTVSNNKDTPTDLKFVLKYDYNWNLYQRRLTIIINRIKAFLSQFNTLSATINIAQSFDISVNTLRQGGTKNIFVQCQIILFYFFTTIITQLKQHVNEGVLKQKLKELFYEDLTRIDQYSVGGSFRHKSVKEINAEAIQAEIDENMVNVDTYVDIDEDNDLIESMRKNTLDDDDYEDSYRN